MNPTDDHNDDLTRVGSSITTARGLSLLQEAEQRRAARPNHLFLDIPTWDGDLVAEYKVVMKSELKVMASRALRRSRQDGEADPAQNDLDLILSACVGLHAFDRETGERVPIEDEYGHVGYDRIMHTLGKADQVQSASEAVKYLMGDRTEDGAWVENMVAISMHGDKIGRWMRDTSRSGASALEELLGEF